jgi:RimJ/RimL family protein N-acetyltransferase
MNPILIDLPMPIITPRLLIKPPLVGDGLKVNAAILESFNVLHRFVDWAKTKPSIDETEAHIRLAAANWILKNNEEPWLELYIFDRKSGDFIGGTGFHHINWDIPATETGYWIRNSYSGQGLMTEAINALTQYAF